MKRFIHPLLLLIARATEKELVQMVEYLKTENRILRSKLPQRIEVTPAERERLLRLGIRLGAAIKHLITIVHPRTFARWVNERKSAAKPRKQGRPRKPEEVRQQVLDMAKATGWGYGRILGELKKLRIRISSATVARLLRENGFDPGPKRGRGTWHDFIQRHIKTVWATDFFTKTVWTVRGPVTFYVLFFLHVHTRRVHLAGMTPNPDGPWMAQVARNMSMVFAEESEEFRPTHMIRDRDTKLTEEFCSILECEGLDHFIVFGERHLRQILAAWLEYYHEFRPHQGIGNVPLWERDSPPPAMTDTGPPGEIVCYESLGGLLKHYRRKAA